MILLIILSSIATLCSCCKNQEPKTKISIEYNLGSISKSDSEDNKAKLGEK